MQAPTSLLGFFGVSARELFALTGETMPFNEWADKHFIENIEANEDTDYVEVEIGDDICVSFDFAFRTFGEIVTNLPIKRATSTWALQ